MWVRGGIRFYMYTHSGTYLCLVGEHLRSAGPWGLCDSSSLGRFLLHRRCLALMEDVIKTAICLENSFLSLQFG